MNYITNNPSKIGKLIIYKRQTVCKRHKIGIMKT
jgi:hypothetical protein